MAFVLLKCLAKAVVKHVGNLFGFGVAGSIVVETWEYWEKETAKSPDHVEIEAIAQLSPDALKKEIESVVQAEAPDLSDTDKQRVISLLQQVSAMARRSLRRSSDPSGRTAPPGVRLERAEDLFAFLPPRLPQFREGDRPLGKWVLVELLGIGGFGEVWKARHADSPGIRAALKFCTGPQAVKFGKHEVQMIDRVMQRGRHDGIVELRNYDIAHDPPWLEYELIDGGELGAWILDQHRINGKIAPDLAAKVMLRLAKTMAFAHQPTPEFIVHRDLKPANILVSRTVENKLSLKIADFGIGSIVAGQSLGQYSRFGANPDERMTSALHGAYTPLYASRQQMDGYKPTPQDDVFALGVIWSQLLTGQLDKGARYGDTARERLKQLGLSDAAIRLMTKCVEPEAEDRLENAIVLAEKLADLLKAGATRPPQPEPPGPRPPRPRPTPGGIPQVNLRVTPEEALVQISTIPHDKCQGAVPNNWKVVGGNVTRQSVAWLFCWAYTGQRSPEAAAVARQVFNDIFDMTFEDYDAQVGLERARRIRY